MSELSYQERLAVEVKNFEKALSQEGLENSIPGIFSYWAGQFVAPRMKRIYGLTDIASIFASELKTGAIYIGGSGFRICSLGSGDCSTEIQIAKILMESDIDFRFLCVEVNGTVINQAKILCDKAGVAQHFEFIECDINNNFPEIEFEAAIANHSLHHFVELEYVFDNVKRRLHKGGVFIVNDMIGRNGHMRWPEALPFVQGAWNLLPKEKKFNFHARCYEYGAFVNYDCTSNGDFEGVRAQDILPLLIDRFGFSKFVAFGNLPDIFVDRAYGKNFSPDDAADRRLIDYLEQLNAHLIDIGVIKPTMMLACLRPEPVDCLYDRWSPEFSVRRPS